MVFIFTMDLPKINRSLKYRMFSLWKDQLRRFQEMELSTRAQTGSFEEFTQYIQNPTVLSTTRQLLEGMPSPRILLSAYLLTNYPDILFSNPRHSTEDTIYECAKTVVHHLESAPESWQMTEFIEIYNVYRAQFEIWKARDREDLLQILAKTHKQVRNWKDLADDDRATEHTLDTLEGLANDLGGKEAVHHVKTSSEWGLVDPTTMALQLSEQMHQAFWDRFTEELSRDPPEFVQYPKLVGEIRRRIEILLPRLEKDRSVAWIRKHLDEDRILGSIQKGEYGLQEVYEVSTFCLERVKELGAAADDARIDAYLTRLHREMAGGTPCIHEIVPNVCKVCLESLDQIAFVRDAIVDAARKDKDPESA